MILTTLVITATLFIAGCSQVEGDALKADANLTIEILKKTEQVKEIENDSVSQKQYINIKEQMTQGLSNLEIVKIKTAFPLMIHTMEKGKEYNFEQIIIDLESMKGIITYGPFREDIEALQGLIQYAIDKRSPESLELAIKMMSELTLFGIDYPYDKRAPKATQGWPEVFKEEQVFNITKSLGNKYTVKMQEIVSTTMIAEDSKENLRTDLIVTQQKIDRELSKIGLESKERLKEKSLQASDLIYEISTGLIEEDDPVVALRERIYTNKETLVNILSGCVDLLPEGDLKVEYSRILGYLEYAIEEITKQDVDYDLILNCLQGSQESLDDISVAILGNVNPKVNKRYSGVLEMLEDNPVLYDWIIDKQTGKQPEAAGPKRNFFGKVLYAHIDKEILRVKMFYWDHQADSFLVKEISVESLRDQQVLSAVIQDDDFIGKNIIPYASIVVENNLATVDLPSFKINGNPAPGDMIIADTLLSLAYTLCVNPELRINKVQYLLDGHKIDTVGSACTDIPISLPANWADGYMK